MRRAQRKNASHSTCIVSGPYAFNKCMYVKLEGMRLTGHIIRWLHLWRKLKEREKRTKEWKYRTDRTERVSYVKRIMKETWGHLKLPYIIFFLKYKTIRTMKRNNWVCLSSDAAVFLNHEENCGSFSLHHIYRLRSGADPGVEIGGHVGPYGERELAEVWGLCPSGVQG